MSDEDGEENNNSLISSENFADDGYADDRDGRQQFIDGMSDADESDVEGSSNSDGLETQDSVQNMVPIEFAKAHIARIEEDMKTMHERHVKLMREMDSNYKMIEKETQEYYVEFLQKWREVAKSKITQYRR